MVEFALRVLALLSRKLLALQIRQAAPLQRQAITTLDSADHRIPEIDRAIVVTTFSSRFDKFCLPLVRALSNGKIPYPIFVVINADWSGPFDPAVRTRFIEALAEFPNTSPVCLGSPAGMSRMWNMGIRAAGASATFVLNDDTLIDSESFSQSLDDIFEKTEQHDLLVVNGSFGHFGITRKCVLAVGEFDERFLGFGEEDADFYWRFEASLARKPAHIENLIGIFNVSDESGYGGQPTPPGMKKYSLFNHVFLRKKYLFGVDGGHSGMFGRSATKILAEPDLREREEWTKEFRYLMYETDAEVISAAISSYWN